MKIVIRRSLAGIAVFAIILLLAGGIAWWSIHTSWFAGLVQVRVVTTLEQATGGRVEIHSFQFNPDTLNAALSGLVVHGTEAAGSEPLLSINSAEVSLRLLSLWSRDIDVESIVFNQPRIHLLVYPDGTTNIPKHKPRNRKDPVEQLLDLKIKHLQVAHGLLQINDQKLPFDFTAHAIALTLDYSYTGPSYGVTLHSDSVSLATAKIAPQPLQVIATAQLYRDRVDVKQLELITANSSSSIKLSGQVNQFAHPIAEANLQADLSLDELAKLASNNQLRNGRAQTTGTVRFDSNSGTFTFEGKASAKGVDYVSPEFTLRNIDVTSDVSANNNGLLLRRTNATARGAHFSGDGSVKSYRVLQVQGRVSQVELKEVGSYLTTQPFPWSGTAHGVAHASAILTDKNPDFIIGAKVDIDPANSGIPAAGNVEIEYHNRTGEVQFADSTLRLPNSTASFNGTLAGDLALQLDSSNLADLQPIIPILGAKINPADLPRFNSGGAAHFEGSLHDLIHQPVIGGNLSLIKFNLRNYHWDLFNSQLTLSSNSISVPHFQLQDSGVNLIGSASAMPDNWSFGNDTPLRVAAHFSNLNIVKALALFTNSTPPFIQGVASGSLNLQGTLNNPHGAATADIKNLDAYGEQLNQIQLDASLDGNRLQIAKGRVQAGPALLNFSGTYTHLPANWSVGDVSLKADTNGFPLASLSSVRKYVPALNARAEAHLDLFGKLRTDSFEPLRMNGSAHFEHVVVNAREIGSASVNAVTQGNAIEFKYAGDLRDTKFSGAAHAQLSTGTPIHGDLQMERINLAMLKSLLSETKLVLPVDGFLDGSLAFDGLLEEPARIRALATIKDLQVSSVSRPTAATASPLPEIVLHNRTPILIDVANGGLTISKFEVTGRDTSITIGGYAPLFASKPVDLQAVGRADLTLFSIFDPNVRSSGSSEIDARITGPLNAISVAGTVQVRNGSFFLSNIPNGLSDVDGTVAFSRNRATIQKMTAHSGGGDISLGGSLSFSEGEPLVYHLEAAARNVRVRYANSISVTSNADLRLSGTSDSSILSGALTVTRVVFTPNADAGNLLAAASSAGASPADQGDFISGLHLDVTVESAPSLQVSTNLSRDVEAEIQLRLRGTPDHPIVLGNITANQGDIKIFGTRFSLNRGEVSFVNTIRIEPVLDLDLETEARGVTVDITVSGTPSKLNFNYRSDPPLQPRDIIALLTVGRTPGIGTTSNAQGASDISALSSGVNSALGQAISPVSNRLSKLFGITNIKIDPFVQGITNTPQARLSVEQQISRDVTVTYVTNLSQTSEQIFRLEWALSRQFSVVAIRDDNGEFGIDFQYKKRFK